VKRACSCLICDTKPIGLAEQQAVFCLLVSPAGQAQPFDQSLSRLPAMRELCQCRCDVSAAAEERNDGSAVPLLAQITLFRYLKSLWAIIDRTSTAGPSHFECYERLLGKSNAFAGLPLDPTC
jgi:hypothetical protein